VGVAFRAVAAAGIRIRPVGDQDDEFRAAVLRGVRRLVRVQVQFRLFQRGTDRRAAYGAFGLNGGVDRAVAGVDRVSQAVAAAAVAAPRVVVLAVVEPHVSEPNAQRRFVRAVDRAVVVVVEDVPDGPLGDVQAAAVTRAPAGRALDGAGSCAGRAAGRRGG